MIDPKELHIGSHVMVGGVRARVTDIESNYDWSGDTLLSVVAVIDGERRTRGAFSQNEGVEPIPITAELLTELGFEKAPFKSYRRDLGEFEPFIRFYYIADGRWRMEVSDDARNYGNIVCKNLHQAEAFLYLTTKTELIKD